MPKCKDSFTCDLSEYNDVRYEQSCHACTKPPKKKAAPVNVVIVEEQEPCVHSCLNDCCTSCVSFIHFVLGALCLALTMYGLANAMFSQDWHGILFGFSYLCFIIPGILIVNKFYGPAKVKTCTDQKFKHILFEVLGLAFQVVGIAMLMKAGFTFETISCMSLHKILGILSIIFIGLCSFSGVFVAKSGRCLCKFLHQVLSFLTFLVTASCFTTGMLTPKFREWSTDHLKSKWPGVLVTFNTFLMIVVTVAMCLNCGKRCNTC